MTHVPNKFPTIPSVKRIAIIGESPGADEVAHNQPLVGIAGRFLSSLLSRAGISRDACFLGQVCQIRPPGNIIGNFHWEGNEIQHGLRQLEEDIEKFNPNIVVLLGNVPLKVAKDPWSNHGWPKKFKYSTQKWRGSLFVPDSGPLKGRKCMATYLPGLCLRDYDLTPFLQFDLKKAVREADSPDLNLPKREFIIPTTVEQALAELSAIRTAKQLTAVDLEGYLHKQSCVGFANHRLRAVVIPFFRNNGSAYWPNAQDEITIWRAVAGLLEDPQVPKVFQNGLYDRFVEHYGHGIRTRNCAEDIMLKHWELYSELGKDDRKNKGKKGLGLDIQASLYTREPYWKDEGGSEDDLTAWQYNGKDCCVTLEICETIDAIWSGQNKDAKNGFTEDEFASMKRHYSTNIALLNPLLYMEIRGIRYNVNEAANRRNILRQKLFELQHKLNQLTGYGFQWKSKTEVFQRARDLLAKKKFIVSDYSDICANAYAGYIGSAVRLKELMYKPNPTCADLGEIEDLCESSLNVDSAKQFIPYLYETLGLPTQFTEKRNEEPKPTADYEALIKLSRFLQKENRTSDPRYAVIQTALELRSLRTRQQMLSISADRDGRIRCGYNLVGSNTGRISSYESPTGSGYNLQTIPNYCHASEAPGGICGDRDLFLADDDHWFFQCDLAGADGWTVAAYANMLGDSTMLDDYRAGVRPFERLTLKLLGIDMPRDRKELLAVCKKHIDKNGWPRFASKRVQHGGCYLEGALTVSRNILKDSEGKLYLSPKECQQLLDYWFTLYWGIRRWHDWITSRLQGRPVLQAASGQVRQFLGRPDDIMTKAVAFEPQANTTYATNMAMYKLWTDPENRVANKLETMGVKLRVEPLHQVHDALCGQFRKADTAWATGKIKQWFANPLTIAGQQITIPFEGGFGPSWQKLNEGNI